MKQPLLCGTFETFQVKQDLRTKERLKLPWGRFIGHQQENLYSKQRSDWLEYYDHLLYYDASMDTSLIESYGK